MSDFRALVDAVFAGRNPRTPPLVEVQWLDATDIDAQWFDEDEMGRAKPAPTLTVGYLMERNTDHIKVVSLVNNDHGANGIVIPMGMVRRITRLSR